MKTAKVIEVIEIKPWNGPKGTVYFHKIKLDNGEVGELGKKQQNGIKVGDTLNYTSEESQYGLKFKAVQENNFNGGGRSSGSPASFSLAYSKDFMVAMIAAGKTSDLKAVEIADMTLTIANKWLVWLKENQ